MTVLREVPPKKKNLKLPPCIGCDTCFEMHEGHLYALVDLKWYCRKCYLGMLEDRWIQS